MSECQFEFRFSPGKPRKPRGHWGALLATWVTAWALSACGGGSAEAPQDPPPAATSRALSVLVVDGLGRYLSGATVASGSASTTSSTTGAATVQVPIGSEQVVRVSKEGFAAQVQPMVLDSASAIPTLRTMLIQREAAQTIATIEAGGTAIGKDGTRITFPAAALVDAQGATVTGSIDMRMTPIDPLGTDLRAFPGAFEGTAPGVTRSAIVTFGSVEFVPSQGGRKLNLAAGKTATIEMPLYATTNLDGSPLNVGDAMPIWSLNESTGFWVQEGSGTVQSSVDSPTGRVVRAAISHFSWWNLDKFAQRGQVCLTLQSASATSGQRALVEARVVAGNGPTALARQSIAVGTGTCMQVVAGGTVQFDAEYEAAGQVCQGRGTASAPAGGISNLTMAMACTAVPAITIDRPSATTLTNSQGTTRVEMSLTGPVPDSVELLANGAVVATFPAQLFYRHELNTSAFADGSTVQLQARTTKGGVARASNAVSLTVDRSPPEIVSRSPATGPVDGSTVYTLTYNEPVRPLLGQSVADLAQLRFTLPGQTTQVQLPANVTLNAARTEVRVSTTATVPHGTVRLFAGPVRDDAENLRPFTIFFDYPVRRDALVAPVLISRLNEFAPSMIRRADGSTLAIHVEHPDGLPNVRNAVVSRRDPASNTWVPLPAGPVNDSPGIIQLPALGQDRNGVVYAFVVQPLDLPNNVSEAVLKRLDSNGQWVLAAPKLPFQGLGGFFDVVMRFDGNNQPVIAASARGSRVWRLQGGALVDLGFPRLEFTDLSFDVRSDGALAVYGHQASAGSGGGVGGNLRIFSNGVWQRVGPTVASSVGTSRMALHNGAPVVAMPVSGLAGTFDVLRLQASGSFETERVVVASMTSAFQGGNGFRPTFDIHSFNGSLVFTGLVNGGMAHIVREIGGGAGPWSDVVSFQPTDGSGQPFATLLTLGDELHLVHTTYGASSIRLFKIAMP